MYCQNSRGKISVQDSLGYTYSNPKDSKRSQNIKFWRCSKRNHGCKSTITVENDFIISRTNSHNHWKKICLFGKVFGNKINFLDLVFVLIHSSSWNLTGGVPEMATLCQNFSGKGRNFMQDEFGHTYSNPRIWTTNENVRVWRCSKRTSSNCKATITVENGIVLSRKNVHNH